jgi:hypothetical protein
MYRHVLDREYLHSLEELHELAGSSHHQSLAGQVNSRWQENQLLKPNSFEAAMAYHGAAPSFSVPIKDIDRHSLPNPRLSAEDRALMKKSKMELYEMGAIVPVTKGMLQAARVIFHHPFLVGKKGTTDKRLCCNFKPGINRYGIHQHYKQNGLPQAKVTLQIGGWMVTIDLEKACHLVALAQWMQRLCGHDGNQHRTPRYSPVGLDLGSVDVRVVGFTTPVHTDAEGGSFGVIRKLGVRVSDLVDDMLVQEESYDDCTRGLFICLFTLRSFGWRISLKKLCTIP